MQQRSLFRTSGSSGASPPSMVLDRLWWSSWRRRERPGCVGPAWGPPRWAGLLLLLLLLLLLAPAAQSFLSKEEEEMLVDLHNHYRGHVSPSASAMVPLKWDSSLKVIAESYAANCIWNHNPELVETGENLFAGSGLLDLRRAVEEWFLEHLDYDFDNNSCDEDKMCGHYTQMVWADTHRVGCAFHLCNNMEGLDWQRVSFLVCNYYPAGNYEGERPYVEGDWCSRCPENLLMCEDNLCVANMVEEEEEEEEEEKEQNEGQEEEEEEAEGTAVPSVQTPQFVSTDVHVLTVQPDGPPGTPAEDTPLQATHTPAEPSVTLAAKEEVKETKEEEVVKQQEEKEDQKKETSGKKEETRRNIAPTIRRGASSAAPVSMFSVLLVCGSTVLTVRL